jgi:hypothetical protein
MEHILASPCVLAGSTYPCVTVRKPFYKYKEYSGRQYAFFLWMMNAHWYGYIDKSTGEGEAQTREVWGSVVDYNPAGHNRASIWVSTSLKTTMEWL